MPPKPAPSGGGSGSGSGPTGGPVKGPPSGPTPGPAHPTEPSGPSPPSGGSKGTTTSGTKTGTKTGSSTGGDGHDASTEHDSSTSGTGTGGKTLSPAQQRFQARVEKQRQKLQERDAKEPEEQVLSLEDVLKDSGYDPTPVFGGVDPRKLVVPLQSKTKKAAGSSKVEEDDDDLFKYDSDAEKDEEEQVDTFERRRLYLRPNDPTRVRAYPVASFDKAEVSQTQEEVEDTLLRSFRRGGIVITDERRQAAIAYAAAYAVRGRALEYTIKAIKVIASVAGIALTVVDFLTSAGTITTTALLALPIVIPKALIQALKKIGDAMGIAERIRAAVAGWDQVKINEGLAEIKEAYGKTPDFHKELSTFVNLAVARTIEQKKSGNSS